MQDGTKRPDGNWKEYQTRRPTPDELSAAYSNGRTGIGIVTGAISGNLEMLEFEGRAVNDGLHQAFIDRAEQAGLADVLDRVVAGYLEQTPTGGVHLFYRCDTITGNLKLARRPATGDELDADPNDRIKVLIETRGEGGYVIIAPSFDTVHPTGEPWRLLQGDLATIASITADEREALHDIARSFDTTPRQAAAPSIRSLGQPAAEGQERPGDWYNRTTTWADLLGAHGWTWVFNHGGEDYWRRPGKTTGTSATTNYADTDLLKVFSTSTQFDTETTYSKFAAYTVLVHGGDYTAAARAIADTMPGDRRPPNRFSELAAGIAAYPPPLPEQPSEGDEDALKAARRLAITKAAERAYTTGGSFVFDTPTTAPAIWGRGEEVLWADGETLIICGPSGVGKTTAAQRICLARAGLQPTVLNYPVQPGNRTLYIVADRPPQAARSMHRMVTPDQRAHLDQHIPVWKGPLPIPIPKDPAIIAELANHYNADTVILDSLKDFAPKLSDEETGFAINEATKIACLAGIQVIALHHQRKRQQGTPKPKSLDDVYGSNWITAGAGSVILLWGEPGDSYIELSHLKQPVDNVGPLQLLHDHAAGDVNIAGQIDLAAVVRTSNGLTPEGAARAMFKAANPAPNEIERARRRLDRLVNDGIARRVGGERGPDGRQLPAHYYITDRD